MLAECVPGGTTTAQAVLTGLGVEAAGLVSGSLRRPAHGLKAALVAQGLAAAGLVSPAQGARLDPLRVAAAVGDPMQPLAAGLVLAAAETAMPVLLAGGSQMAAVIALALALAPVALRPRLTSLVALGTTAWVASEASSDLSLLLRRVGRRWGASPWPSPPDCGSLIPSTPPWPPMSGGSSRRGGSGWSGPALAAQRP